ncbi:MAG: hypothetical protein COW04_02675 [Deltaproteobacteria bacterium CG12_big_fil_rev_8_21_14_0_65_43_10]|nr:MAG: hypothetical protein COW04_02675 [Deltaproteobacteria bacterium CG12_big_fil_rev_8_21_14_0_65_43_10]PIU84464.1 MAG: hypothetical protein COS67_13135 [Deltaproteobacteria bacterium CG06_land_8_20_14_3_00_44_19]PIX25306.1 MAG: hypothetical protein COZ68_04265 [Deltaproteobacteria bacterium CG_4_8_14_3_um_filter_43_13]PIZ19703.1 MAG: hypothetical protein COY50_08705 [Deltaproteobacteria bacterium CG_4_10_14_0_8_um_filter_43_12]PJB40112.1 MAG: hypothetical protein CO106_09355 [Deltaproteoba
MKSKIAEAIKMKYSPVAILWTDERPEKALQFKEGRWGCETFLLCSAAKGRVAAADRETFGCIGGGVGLGFGNQYLNFPGGIEYYISTGNPEFCNTEMGKKIAEDMPELVDGEGYVKNPELAKEFVNSLPMIDVPTRYVVFKPIELVSDDEEPKVIIFLVNPDQLSALVVLANYDRESNVNVIAPFGAGCHQIGILPYREGESLEPNAIIGLTDLSARKRMMRMVDKDILSFTVPFKMFQEMEGNVEGSFLEKETWASVIGIKEGD